MVCSASKAGTASLGTAHMHYPHSHYTCTRGGNTRCAADGTRDRSHSLRFRSYWLCSARYYVGYCRNAIKSCRTSVQCVHPTHSNHPCCDLQFPSLRGGSYTHTSTGSPTTEADTNMTRCDVPAAASLSR